MKSRKELSTLAAMLALRGAVRNPDRIAEDALKLARLGAAAASNAVALCNGWKQQDAYDKKARSIERHAAEICRHYWLSAKVGGDPRGYCLKLRSTYAKKPLAGNTWGGDEEGYGV